MEFKEYRLGDIIKEIIDYRGKTPKKLGGNWAKSGIKAISAKNIKTGKILQPETIRFVDEKLYKKWMKQEVEKGTILITSEAPFGEIFYWDSEEKIVLSQRIFGLKIKQEYNSKFIYYYMSTKKFQDELRARATGSTVMGLRQPELLKCKIIIPDREAQDNMVEILNAVDKKIELNNQINNNLYEYAISYLKSVVSDEEVAISSLGKVQGGYAFKSKDLKDNKTRNRIIKIKNLRSEINADINNSQFVDDDVILNIDKKFELHKGDVAIAMTGAELGKTGFIYGKDKYYLNQRVGVIKGSNKETELYLRILMLSKDFQTLLNSKGYGSAQPNISTTDIENIMINNITEENLAVLYKTINPIYQKIINNCEENINLEQLRETLLPKLMNGEIDLDKIKI